MTKNHILFCVVVLLLTSCAPVTASPTPPTVVPLTPTTVPSPTPSAIPTRTPYASLQTRGPYLLFTRPNDKYENKALIIMDADGRGRKQIQVPNDGYIDGNLQTALSPDGKWLTYFTGSTEKPYDLALNLLNLEDETTFPVARLIAPGYPENLASVTVSTSVTAEEACSNNVPCRIGIVQMTFGIGLRSVAWSPDSKSLAFIAQIDGPSSDVYLFGIDQRTIRRLVADTENVNQVLWSPDGRKILYLSSVPGMVYTSNYIYVADPFNKSVQSPKRIDGGVFWFGEGWINENSYLLWDGGEGAPPHGLRYINVETGQVKQVWKYVAEAFFVDKENKRILLVSRPLGIDSLQPEPESGVYMVAFDGTSTKITDDLYYPLEQDPFGMYFVTHEYSQLAAIDPQGTIVDLSRKRDDYAVLRVSPDQKWVLLPSDQGTELYSETLQLYRKIWDRPSKIIWRPDSLGAFLFLDTSMYYLPIPDGEPVLIEDCAPNYCSINNYTWLP